MTEGSVSSLDKRFCECRCGGMVTYNKNKPRRFIKGHHYKMMCLKPQEQRPNWQGGRHVNSQGYITITKPGHPRVQGKSNRVLEHILVMEEYLGRHLLDSEVIHHKDGDRQNNKIDNLQLMENQSQHRISHHSNIGKTCPYCKGENVRKRGIRHNVIKKEKQIMRCKSCRKYWLCELN